MRLVFVGVVVGAAAAAVAMLIAVGRPRYAYGRWREPDVLFADRGGSVDTP